MATAERTYQGPAALLLNDTEYPVTAELTAYPTPSGNEEWCGLLKTGNPLEDFARFGNQPVTLRLPHSKTEGENGDQSGDDSKDGDDSGDDSESGSRGGSEAQVLLHGWGSQYVRVQGASPTPF